MLVVGKVGIGLWGRPLSLEYPMYHGFASCHWNLTGSKITGSPYNIDACYTIYIYFYGYDVIGFISYLPN